MVLLGTVPVDDKVDALAFTPDSKTLIASDKDTFRAFNANTGESVKTISAPKGVRSNFVLFTKDGKTMITANSDGAIRFYDWETGEVSQTLDGHQSPMIGLVLSPSGKLLASGGTDRLVKVWDVETGKIVQELSGFSYAAPVLIFSEDEKQLTTFGGVNTPTRRTEKLVWSIEDGNQQQTDIIDDFGPPFAITKDGATLAAWSELKTKISSTQFTSKSGVRTYKVATGEKATDLLQLYMPNPLLLFALNKAVMVISSRGDMSFNSDFGTLLWGGTTFTANGQGLRGLPSTRPPQVIVFSPDSRILATWYDNLKVNIYRAP